MKSTELFLILVIELTVENFKHILYNVSKITFILLITMHKLKKTRSNHSHCTKSYLHRFIIEEGEGFDRGKVAAVMIRYG